jgi:DNA repair protein RadC
MSAESHDRIEETPLPLASKAKREKHAWATDELPREKFDRAGAAALTDIELLALFFGTGTQGLNVLEMSRELLERYGGSLVNLSRLSVDDLQTVRGIGEAKAKHLAAAFELGKRLAREVAASEPLESPRKIYEAVSAEFQAYPHEVVKVILLNARMHPISVWPIGSGSINSCIARPIEIIRPAIVQMAFAFILVHNHPSGDPAPSQPDREVTRKLNEMCPALGLKFHDHLIIGRPSHGWIKPYFSFREVGLISGR